MAKQSISPDVSFLDFCLKYISCVGGVCAITDETLVQKVTKGLIIFLQLFLTTSTSVCVVERVQAALPIVPPV